MKRSIVWMVSLPRCEGYGKFDDKLGLTSASGFSVPVAAPFVCALLAVIMSVKSLIPLTLVAMVFLEMDGVTYRWEEWLREYEYRYMRERGRMY